MPNRVNVDQLLIDLRNAATAAGFEVQTYGQVNHWPLHGFIRRATGSHEGSRQGYISSGIHGDEPAGPLALLELIRSDALPRDCELWICPLMNPAGLAAATRENPQGNDLNRDYTEFASPETRRSPPMGGSKHPIPRSRTPPARRLGVQRLLPLRAQL